MDEPSPKHDTVAAVLSLIFTVYSFGCCYTVEDLHPWSFLAKLDLLGETFKFLFIGKENTGFPCDWIFIFVSAAFIIHAWAGVKKKKITCWLGRKTKKWTVYILQGRTNLIISSVEH